MVKTEDFSSAHRPYRTYINGGGGDMSSYDANNMYVVRSNRGHAPRSYGRERQICKAAPEKEKSIMWHSKRELKRRRRIAKYKLYSMEGKMKDSFKKGYRWIKRTCLRIVHGF